MDKKILFLFLFLILTPGLLCAGYYQYLDESGKPVFTDDISRIPQDLRNTATWVTGNNALLFPPGEDSETELEEPSAMTQDIPGQEKGALERENTDLGAQKQRLEETLDGLKRLHQSLMDQREVLDANNVEALNLFNAGVSAYNKAMDDYEKELNAFNKRVLEYNKRIAELDEARKKRAAGQEKEKSGDGGDPFWDDDDDRNAFAPET